MSDYFFTSETVSEGHPDNVNIISLDWRRGTEVQPPRLTVRRQTGPQ